MDQSDVRVSSEHYDQFVKIWRSTKKNNEKYQYRMHANKPMFDKLTRPWSDTKDYIHASKVTVTIEPEYRGDQAERVEVHLDEKLKDYEPFSVRRVTQGMIDIDLDREHSRTFMTEPRDL